MRELSIRALGPLEVAVDDDPVELGGPKQRTVLAVLAVLANEPVSADRIVDEVWGESPPGRAAHSLQTYVSNLRRLLGRERIETRRPGYVLLVREGELDAARFEALLAAGRRQGADPGAAAGQLTEALSLWRGDDPYAGLADDVPVLGQEAARLRELRLVAVEHLAEARLALGDEDALVPELQDLAERFPFREAVWSLLMRALYASGRQAEALRAYRTLRTGLVEELGIDPSPELQELEQRLLTQTEPPAGAAERLPTVSLPPTPSRFIGRAEELDEVTAAVGDGRLVTLTGPAGVGKTRLAIEAARRLAGRFTDGTYFVDLAPVDAPGDVPGAVASGLGVNDQSGRPPAEVVADFLAGRHVLVVLDNCEHVSDEVAGLAWRWLGRGEGIHVLASSQDRLELDGERVLTVAPLSLPGKDAGEDPSDAVALFLTRAREQVPGFDPVGEELSAVAQICRMLDGLPLAIELAAARVRTLAPSEIVTRLDDRFALLGSGSRSRPARHQTLRAAVEWSYALLDDRERKVFDRLAVLAGNFSLDAAAHIAAPAAADAEFIDVLDALVSRSLVARLTWAGGSRYRMLETLRAFGRDRLVAEGRLDDLERRRASYFARLAVREADRVQTHEFREAIAAVDADLDNIRQSFRWAVAGGEPDTAFDLARPMWSLVFAGARRHLREGEAWRAALLEAAPDDAMRARLLAEQGFSRFFLGHQKEAIDSAQRSLAMAAGSPERALALQVLALCAATNRETERALELAAEVEALAGEHPDARGLESQAMALIFAGRGGEAADVVDRIFEEAERTDNPLRRIRALALMGAALQTVDLERSRRFLDEAVSTTEALGMDWDLAGAVLARAITRLLDDDPAGSLGDLEWACRLTYRVRDLRRLAQTLEVVGMVAALAGPAEEAVKVLGAAGAIRERTGAAGSEAEESRRREALRGLEATLEPGAYGAAFDWGRSLSAEEAAGFGASLAGAARGAAEQR